MYILDCLMVCGRNVSKQKFSDRINHADTVIEFIKQTNYKIEKKKFVSINKGRLILSSKDIKVSVR